MSVLRWVLGITGACGCWRPPSWTSPFKKHFYDAYTLVLFATVHFVTFSQLMDMILNVRTQDEFSEGMYLLLVMIVSCHKMSRLLASRRHIAGLMNVLQKEPFLPRNEEETEIRARYDRRAEFNSICYAAMVEITATCISFGSALTNVRSRQLPCRAWLPYDYSSLRVYILTYVQQVIGVASGGLVHVACDSLICGLLIHACSQIELLGCRLRAIDAAKTESVKPFIRYHRQVYRFVRAINKEFRMVIFVQFAVSMSFVCINLLQLTTMKGFSSKVLTILSYTCCMLTQIFFYCWYGNEVKLKSLEIPNIVFEADWTPLETDTKKSLLMIMRHARIPIEISSIHVVSMNLESFVNLLKMSYSAFNVLQQGKEQ